MIKNMIVNFLNVSISSFTNYQLSLKLGMFMRGVKFNIVISCIVKLNWFKKKFQIG